MRFRKIVLFTLSVLMTTGLAQAADRVVTGSVSGTQTINSDEGVVFENAAINTGANITVQATYYVRLKPGTRISDGVRFAVAQIPDKDGLPNRCEMPYFHHLNFGPGEDSDGDKLTNLEECTLGTNPNSADKDNDDDGMEDWWEIKYFGLGDMAYLIENNRDDDYDGDGIPNYIEYQLETDPNAKHPGLHYTYDDLGRISRIERIPSP